MSYAYLPMEIKSRELRSRLQIAEQLLAQKSRVVIGQQWGMFLNIEALPRGVVLLNTVNDIKAKAMAEYKARGCAVTALDEESLFRTNQLTRTFTESAARSCDAFFCQNARQSIEVQEKYPALYTRVTGNPRVELKREDYEKEAVLIRAEHGPFVLFNTNFATINSAWGLEKQENILQLAGVSDPKKTISEDARLELLNRQEFCQALIMAAERGIICVVRPHPGENADWWRAFSVAWPNVHIVANSNPQPYLCACEFMFHSNCTTGLEAAILDVPCVNIVVELEREIERVTTVVNPRVKTGNIAYHFYNSQKGLNLLPNDRDRLAEFYPNIAKPGAAALIANEMISLAPGSDKPGKPYVFHRRNGGYTRKLVIELDEMAQQAGAMSDRLGKELDLTQLDESLFLLEAA